MPPPARKPFGLSWEGGIFLALLLYPLFPMFERGLFAATGRSLGEQLPLVFIFALLAYGLNVVVGYTGLLHLGIAAFFAVGAYTAGIFSTAAYAFQWPFWVVLPLGALAAAGVGLLLGAPTLRLRGDYLALVTLGFGEVTKFTLKNVVGITAGSQGLSPINPPTDHPAWSDDFRPFYYLTLGVLILAALLLRNLERSRLGRAWIALREDELAANCMGLNPAKLKLAAFALGSGLAGLAGVLYATRLTSTADPNAYDFNRSIFLVCCLIVGGLGSRLGALLGVMLLVGFDNILTPIIDGAIQQQFPDAGGKIFLTFTGWRLAVFGLALILMMRFRPEGLFPSSRVKHELHPDEAVSEPVEPITMGKTTGEVAAIDGGKA
ncbi:MAG: branched-chain amino acid ABC transporter permease [Fimbriiglobus sp.]|jgi:branched-chain amino acid transport system permease protein|nr:branched-chain amino acid ABC transporter permease [Fimbriiglobus sp.]